MGGKGFRGLGFGGFGGGGSVGGFGVWGFGVLFEVKVSGLLSGLWGPTAP